MGNASANVSSIGMSAILSKSEILH